MIQKIGVRKKMFFDEVFNSASMYSKMYQRTLHNRMDGNEFGF